MAYTVWIKVENDDGQPGDKDEGWCAIATGDTRDDAVDIAEDALLVLERSGYDVSDPLDGWRQ